jgi:cell division protein FtsW (lipid II flippase)
VNKRELFWGIISFCLILLAYVIPYTILSDVAKWYGSFLLWVVIALLIIGVNDILTRKWRD